MEEDLIDTAGEITAAVLAGVGAAACAVPVVDYWQQKLDKQKREAERDDCPGCIR